MDTWDDIKFYHTNISDVDYSRYYIWHTNYFINNSGK